jgi:hypothetical protein
MSVRYLVCAVIFAQMHFTNALAQSGILSRFSSEQAIYLMQLGNAYGTARFCNLGIGLGATRVAALAAFGPEAKISPDQAMDILMIVDGIAAASEDTIFSGRWTPKDKQKKCAEMLKLFGPNGTLIKGAVEP